MFLLKHFFYSIDVWLSVVGLVTDSFDCYLTSHSPSWNFFFSKGTLFMPNFVLFYAHYFFIIGLYCIALLNTFKVFPVPDYAIGNEIVIMRQ